MHVIDSLAPVFLTVAVGYALTRMRLISAEWLSGLTWIAYWVALPCLLFGKIAAAPLLNPEAGRTLLIVLTGAIACLLVSLLVAVLIRMPAERIGTLVQVSVRGNIAYVGLAVVFYAFDARGEGAGDAAQASAALVLAPMVVFNNAVAVTALLASRHRLGLDSVRRIARGLATNPLVLASLGGAAVSAAGLALPVFLTRTCHVIGQFGLPAALIAVGGSLAITPVAGRVLPAALGAAIKVWVAPIVGFLMALALGAGPDETQIALILLACPTAVASYILTKQIGGDEALASSAVVFSTLLSFISLSLVVAMF
jgi:malate permease and related proteins